MRVQISPEMQIVMGAFLLGVIVPSMSFLLMQIDTCMPREEDGFYIYLPLITSLFRGCR